MTTPVPSELWVLPVDPDAVTAFVEPVAPRFFRVPTERRRRAALPVEEKGPPVFVAMKTPNEELDYGFDWTDWLVPEEEISDSGWTITPDDATLTTLATDADIDATSIWLLDGTVGTVYTVTNTVFTSSTPVSRHAQRSFQLRIVDTR